MAMFDWNDEELTNIIWGDTGESGDHIVPYPIQNEEKHRVLFQDLIKRETNQGTSNVSPVDQKKPPISTELGVESVCSSKHGFRKSLIGFSLDSSPDYLDKSIINAAKSDQDNIGTAGSNNKAKILKDGIGQFDTGSEFFRNPPENEEQDEYADYEWANIGSFDDLDRIFSNDEAIFGDVSGNANDPLLSSNDASSNFLRLTPTSVDSSDMLLAALKASSDESDIKSQSTLESSQSFLSVYENLNETKSRPQNVQVHEKRQACHSQLDDANAATLQEVPEKLFAFVQGDKQKALLKGQKVEEKTEVKQLHDFCAAWSPSPLPFQLVQYAQPAVNPYLPSVLSKKSQFQRTAKNISGSHLERPLYGNMVHHYPATSVLSQLHPVEGNHNLANANLRRKSLDTAIKPPAMTPEEKIEKLRRRQQLRAILAIQKQQQQFGNQVSVVENSTMERRNVKVDENNSCFSCLDNSSSMELNDNKTDSIYLKKCSIEESVLRRLQDTISKLDIRTRLCFRDSLFRLGQSAMQRQCQSDTSSVNTSSRDDIISNTDIVNHDRFTEMPDVETNTNPIDRIVAHLLFHTPLEFSGKLSETADSPVSSNFSHKRKTNALKSLAKGYFPENSQITFPRESMTPCIYFEKNRSKSSSCLDAVDNVSSHEATNGLMNVEASKS